MASPGLFLQIRQAIAVGIVCRVVEPRFEAIPDFPAVAQAVAVAVGIPRIGAMRQNLGGVVQFVAVGIRRQRIGSVRRNFGGIAQAIAIGVGVLGVRAVAEFLGVRQAVVVRILGRVVGQGIQPHEHFPLVRKPVAVRIDGPRIGAVNHDFSVIVEAVAVGIRRQRIGAVGHGFRAIVQPVAVRVRQRRVGPQQRHFHPIGQAVAVGIDVQRTGAAGVFLRVAQAVAVGIARRRFLQIAVPMALPGIRQAVGVGIGQTRRRRRRRPGAVIEIGAGGAPVVVEGQHVEHAAHAPMQRHARRQGIDQHGPVHVRRGDPHAGARRGEVGRNADLPIVGLGLFQRRPAEPQDRVRGRIAGNGVAGQRAPQSTETPLQPSLGDFGHVMDVLPSAGPPGPVDEHGGRIRHHQAGPELRRRRVRHVLRQPVQVVSGIRDAVDDFRIGAGMRHHETAEPGIGSDRGFQPA